METKLLSECVKLTKRMFILIVALSTLPFVPTGNNVHLFRCDYCITKITPQITPRSGTPHYLFIRRRSFFYAAHDNNKQVVDWFVWSMCTGFLCVSKESRCHLVRRKSSINLEHAPMAKRDLCGYYWDGIEHAIYKYRFMVVYGKRVASNWVFDCTRFFVVVVSK